MSEKIEYRNHDAIRAALFTPKAKKVIRHIHKGCGGQVAIMRGDVVYLQCEKCGKEYRMPKGKK